MLLMAGCSSTPAPLKANPERIEALSATVGFSYTPHDGEHLSGRGYLTVIYPNRFRFTVVSPFGGVIADLIGTEQGLLSIDHQRRVFIRQGQGDPPRIPFASLVGAIPRIVTPLPSPCTPRRRGGVEIIEVVSQDGFCFPRAVTVAEGGGELQIRLDDYEMNPDLPPDLMTPDLDGFSEMTTLLQEQRR